ncbi:MAG: glycosyltransferase family 4 protein [Verrucomicrobiota bacterium]
METGRIKWICAQLGAREHYAIPRALQSSGRLEMVFTEMWAGPLLRRLSFGPLRAISTRFHPDLSSAHVISWTWSTLIHRNTGSLKHRNTGPYQRFIHEGKWFSEHVRDYLARRKTEVRGKVVFSYDTTALELFQWAKARGAICVLGQMDPGRVEYELVREEARRWPGWSKHITESPNHRLRPGGARAPERNIEVLKHRSTETPKPAVSGRAPCAEIANCKSDILNPGADAYFQRREAEWKLADRIIVNSRWSLDALVQQGVPPSKIEILPLAYEINAETLKHRNTETPPSAHCHLPSSPSGPALTSDLRPLTSVFPSQVSGFSVSAFPPLRVLWLGQVNLRKGIQYLVAAANLLQDAPVYFDVVGPIGIAGKAVKSAPPNVRFHGPVSRDRAAEWYGRSDVFVLPTISDGFAITQIEAMAHGLPVIATPNCGAVVADGVDGCIVPARDADALAEAIRRYLADRKRLQTQSAAARDKSRQFSLAMLSDNLVKLEDKLNQ